MVLAALHVAMDCAEQQDLVVREREGLECGEDLEWCDDWKEDPECLDVAISTMIEVLLAFRGPGWPSDPELEEYCRGEAKSAIDHLRGSDQDPYGFGGAQRLVSIRSFLAPSLARLAAAKG
jgi:hypothetical protein